LILNLLLKGRKERQIFVIKGVVQVPALIILHKLTRIPFLLLLAFLAPHSLDAVWIWAHFVIVILFRIKLDIARVATFTDVKMAAAPVGVKVVLVIDEGKAMATKEAHYLLKKWIG